MMVRFARFGKYKHCIPLTNAPILAATSSLKMLCSPGGGKSNVCNFEVTSLFVEQHCLV